MAEPNPSNDKDSKTSTNPINNSQQLSNQPDLDQVENQALDALPTSNEPDIDSVLDNESASLAGGDTSKPIIPKRSLKEKILGSLISSVKHLDIYVVIFFTVILIAIIAVVYGVNKNKTSGSNGNKYSVPLSQSALSQLNNNDTQIGSNGTILTIQSNTVFDGSALIKGNLQIAGTVQFGGNLEVPGITVTGATRLADIDGDNLTLAGDETIAGPLTVQQGLTVNGATDFSGPVSAPQITVSTLQVNGDIQISHHLITNGSIPKISSSSVLGSGGTASISGDDTAGEVQINTTGDASNGCLATITFSKSFSTAPNVVITEVQNGSSAPPSANFYVIRSTTGFSICSQSTLASASFGIDYIVID